MQRPDELRLAVGWGRLAAWQWPRNDAPKILALHGWMDNAASFARLAPLLEGADLVALESAGHGNSDHRPSGAHYHFTDFLYDLDRALDELAWKSCILLGHSLGGSLAACYAAAAPERVDRLIMLDSIGPLSAPAGEITGQLRKSLNSIRNPRRHARVYPRIRDAARARQKRMSMTDKAARLLAQRALRGGAGAWRWRTDPRLMWSSPFRMTEQQVRVILSDIQCPVLLITSPVLSAYLSDHVSARLACFKDVRHIALDGGHHVHMDEPGLVAAPILDFLKPLEKRDD